MPRNLQTLSQLQAKINRLEQENAQLRLLFRVILDTAFLAVNGQEEKETLYCWRCGLTIPAGHLCSDCGAKEDEREPEKEKKEC